MRLVFVAGAALFGASAPAAAQISASLEAAADNTIYSGSNNSNGQGPGLFAGTTATGEHRRALLRFDLSAIPLHAPIASATLTLHMNKTTSGAANFDLHALREDWGEGPSNAGDPGGGGTLAGPGDATWTFAFFNTVAWSVAGGTFDGTPSATTSVNLIGTYSWTSAQVRADVQRWVDTPEDNFGWLLRGPEGLVTTAKRFDSDESAVPADRPRLVIEYFCPADFDRNDFVNGDDFDGFVAAFLGGC